MQKQATLSYSVKSRSAHGSGLLIVRQALVQASNFFGTILLARFLTIEDYGFYGVLFFLFSFLNNFGDIGFAASLIRQKCEPETIECSTIFWAQSLITISMGIIFIISAPYICLAYNLPKENSIFLVLCAISFFILLFRTIPTVRLERHLDFKILSYAEVTQAVLYNSLAVFLAFKGWGAYSFTLALIARILTGAIILNVFKPYKPKLEFDRSILAKHLKFSIPFQVTGLVNSLKDSFSPILVGLMIGLEASGIVNITCTAASFPVMLIFILNRLFLPAFSRLHEKQNELRSLLKTALIATNAFVAPLAIFILLYYTPFVSHVFGSKWTQSQQLFPYLWISNLILPSTIISQSLLNAFGKPNVNLIYSVVWMVISLGLGTPLVHFFGIKAFGYVNIAICLSSAHLIYSAQKMVNVNIFKEAVIGWIPAVLGIITILPFAGNQTPSKLFLAVIFLTYFLRLC